MNLLSDIVTYVRRIIKSPSNAQITDNLIIDYINRFWLMDMDARIQLFDFKTTYSFQTIPGIDKYNMPVYSLQTEPGSQSISYYPVYQGFASPCYVNGIQIPFYGQRDAFYNIWPNFIQWNDQVATGDGGSTYQLTLPWFPAVPGHVDMTGIIKSGAAPTDPLFLTDVSSPTIATAVSRIPTTSIMPGVTIAATDSNGNNIVVTDSGIFLGGNTSSELYGVLINPGAAPYGNTTLGSYSTTSNTVNYQTGVVNVTFPSNIPSGNAINVQCNYYEQGMPRAVLFYDNYIQVRNPPNTQYQITLDGYLSPAAFLTTSDAVQFAYMCEYIARGAARKILSDTGDIEQFNFYEPFFIEQEQLVWKRSQRQFTSVRTQTIFSEAGISGSTGSNSSYGGT